MQINYRIAFIVLVTILLSVSITLGIVFWPQNNDKNGMNAANLDPKNDNNDPNPFLPKDPNQNVNGKYERFAFRLRDNDLVDDKRNPNYTKLRGGRRIIPLIFNTIDDFDLNTFNQEGLIAILENTNSSENASELVITYQARDTINTYLGTVHVGKWDINITPSSIQRNVSLTKERYTPDTSGSTEGTERATGTHERIKKLDVIDYYEDGHEQITTLYYNDGNWGFTDNQSSSNAEQQPADATVSQLSEQHKPTLQTVIKAPTYIGSGEQASSSSSSS